MIKTADLDHQERDLATSTRQTPSVLEADADPLAAVLARIEAARTILPQGRDLHCLDCFQRGRDAAIRTIEGKT